MLSCKPSGVQDLIGVYGNWPDAAIMHCTFGLTEAGKGPGNSGLHRGIGGAIAGVASATPSVYP